MPSRLLPTRPVLKSLLLLLGLSLVLGACSRIGLAYRNLDTLVPWWLGGYLDLDPTQQQWLDQRLAEHLSWHCSTELPRYIDWLARTEQLIRNGQTSTAVVSDRLDELRVAQQRVAEQITPSVIDLLQGLQPRQVAELQARLEEKQQELQDKYLAPSLPEQIDERAERLEKRLQPWFGNLNPTQQARVKAWSIQLGPQNSLWLEDRARTQEALLAALEQPQAATFEPRLKRLLQEPEALQQAQYRQAFARSRQALGELLADLLASAEPAQRRQLLKRLDEVRSDFANVRCDTPTAVAAS
ncbi:MAG: DUF6279 family lipoprotein [Pseudomonadota bacterium]